MSFRRLFIGWLGVVLFFVSADRTPGQCVRREFWMGVAGSIGDLLALPSFPNSPSGVTFPETFEGPSNWSDNYGTRMRGYVHPPATGTYFFWTSSDDQSQLFLSSDESPATKTLIARVDSWTGAREWGKEPNQKSAAVPLEAGHAYYIEVLHAEGGGGDNVAVAWQLPDGAFEGPIPGSRLSPFVLSTNPPTIKAQPQSLDLDEGQPAVFQVIAEGAEPLLYQWQRNGIVLPLENNSRLILEAVELADDETRFRCIVSNALNQAVSDEAILRVHPERQAPVILQLTPPAGVTVRSLTQVRVVFSEAVRGVSSAVLCLNGQPATHVTGLGAGPYLFDFPPPPPGLAQLAWITNHGITDRSLASNAFAGGAWQVTVNPAATPGDVVLNEILAANVDGLADEDGEHVDWLELRNYGSVAVPLLGWSLSDNDQQPGQWVFPDVTLEAGACLVVYASGKDRRPTARGGYLHTNFKFSQAGEFIGLYSPEWPPRLVDSLSPQYPEQRNNYSYGRDPTGAWKYYAAPTPGQTNGFSTLIGLTEPPHFSASRGFYRDPFNLYLTCATPGAVIRYTTNGSEPTLTNGLVCAGPLRLATLIPLRAAAFASNRLPSRVVSHTFLFGLTPPLRSLPALSLTTARNNLWGPTGIMETNPRNTVQHGIAWERPVSAEWIEPADNGGFQIDCGLRVQGGGYVRQLYDPNAGLPFSKYSFRLYFRGDYGPGTLRFPLFPGCAVREFNNVALRAGMNDPSNPFLVDELVRRLLADTGQLSSHGTFVNLFINGEYKGYYNPAERIDEDFMRAWTSSTNAFDVQAQFGEIIDGDVQDWNNLTSLIASLDLSRPENYAQVAARLDLDNFIDYLLVNIYAGTGDWPHNNWRAARERRPGAQWRFLIWDAEWSFGNTGRAVTLNTLTSDLAINAPAANFYRALMKNPEFRFRFADRVHQHFFNGGALMDETIRARFLELKNTLAEVIPALAPHVETWIAQRRPIILQQLANAGLQLSSNAPIPNLFGGPVPPGFNLKLSAPAGTIYYTLDGSDPRAPATTTTEQRSLTLLRESAPKRALVPSVANGGDQLGDAWKGRFEPFDDGSWRAGTNGVGYDRETTYREFIGLDVAEMDNTMASVYIRAPFTVAASNLAGLNVLKLNLRYDDGFVAYLNGEKIAEANPPVTEAWDAAAGGSNPDGSAVVLAEFDASEHLSALRAGTNILAIQGLNSGVGSSDLLLSFELAAAQESEPVAITNGTAYRGSVVVNQTCVLKARTLLNQRWSALLETTFQVNLPGWPVRLAEIMYQPPGGEACEYVELCNLSPLPVSLAGLYFDGVDFLFPPDAVIAGNDRLVLASAANPVEFATRYPGVKVAGYFSGKLANQGERLALLAPDGSVIHAVTYATVGGWPVEAAGAGASLEIVDPLGDPNSPANWRASAQADGTPGDPPEPLPAPLIRLNEIQAGFSDGDDWIELYNAGETTVDLSGWSLTDRGESSRFVVPDGTLLASNRYLMVWCGERSTNAGFHADFGLDRSGDEVYLFDAEVRRVDAVGFGAQVAGCSIGRAATEISEWQLTVPTPGASNRVAAVAAPASVKLNEWLANAAAASSDWFELFNSDTNRPAALRGLCLSSGNATFRIGTLAFLAPGGFLRFWADENPGPNHVEFKLSAAGDNLILRDASGQFLEQASFGAQTEGVSEGRLPDGSRSIRKFPGGGTPGASNVLPAYSGPVFNEFMADNRVAVTNGLGQCLDWIELRNPGAQPFPLGGFGVAVGADATPAWRFPEGASVPGYGFLTLWCDARRPGSTNLETELQLGRALPREGGMLRLFDAAGRVVDQAAYGSQPTDRSVGRIGAAWELLATPTPGRTNSGAASLGAVTNLCFNEWLAAPAAGEPWFELYNSGALPVRLTGLYVSDDPSLAGLTNRYQFGPLSFLDAHAWLRLVADGSVGNDVEHVDFRLNEWGEHLRLIDTNLVVLNAIDFGRQTIGVSEGRIPDGATNRIVSLVRPSPGESNFLPLDQVAINEVLPRAAAPFEQAIELHNLTGASVGIGGWYLSDTAVEPKKFRLPSGTVLAPRGFVVVYENRFNGGFGSLAPFSLDTGIGAAVYLSAVDAAGNLTGYRTQVTFGPSAKNVSFGRHVTSVGVDFVAQSQPTFGVAQPANPTAFRLGKGAVNAGPLVGPIVINEILAQPPDRGDFAAPGDAEFLELLNLAGTPVDLFEPTPPSNTWRLSGGVDFSFPAGCTVPAGGRVLLVGFNPATDTAALTAFCRRYDVAPATKILGPFNGRLADEGETVSLSRPDAPIASGPLAGRVPYVLVEAVSYAGASPWPTNGIGEGASLQRRNAAGYGNEPTNWIAAVPTAGHATVAEGEDSDGDGLPDAWEREHGFDPFAADDAALDADGDGASNRDEFRSGTDPRSADSVLRILLAGGGTGGRNLRFHAAAGRSYVVQYRDDLGAGAWTVLAQFDAGYFGQDVEVEDPNPLPPTGQRYYRLVTRAPAGN